MEIISIKLNNTLKAYKHITISTKDNFYSICLFDLCERGGIDEQVKSIACECFYWLFNDDKVINKHTWTYDAWKEYIQDRMDTYNQFDTQEHANMAIESFYTYKKYL